MHRPLPWRQQLQGAPALQVIVAPDGWYALVHDSSKSWGGARYWRPTQQNLDYFRREGLKVPEQVEKTAEEVAEGRAKQNELEEWEMMEAEEVDSEYDVLDGYDTEDKEV